MEVPYPSAQLWRLTRSSACLWGLSKSLTRQWGLLDVQLVYKGSLISTSSIESPCPPNRLQGSLISTSSIKTASGPSLLQHVFGSFLILRTMSAEYLVLQFVYRDSLLSSYTMAPLPPDRLLCPTYRLQTLPGLHLTYNGSLRPLAPSKRLWGFPHHSA